MPHLDASALTLDPTGLATLADVLRPSRPAAPPPPAVPGPRAIEARRAGPTARALMAARILKPGVAGPPPRLALH